MEDDGDFPQYTDLPQQFWLVSADDIVLWAFCVGLGIFLGMPFRMALLGIVVAFTARRFNARRPRGHVWHWLYWHGLLPVKGLASPFDRIIEP